jgi:hypothetical protein
MNFQVMEDGGRRFWFEGIELGRAKAGNVEEAVARITGELLLMKLRGEEEESEGQDDC